MKVLALVAVAAVIWLFGLFAFAERVRNFTPAPEPARAEGIVALTGPSAERIHAAVRLLERDKGERLLVSGVNREVRRQELRALIPGSNRLFDCCVDLGFDAEDTLGNAQEIAAWAESRDYDTLIVVTSDYHMPRSLLEIRSAAPGVQLTPYAVSTPSLHSSRWWRAAETARRMTLEYNKYLGVMAREGVRRMFGDRTAEATREAMDAAAGNAERTLTTP